jgi:hypothetical protein
VIGEWLKFFPWSELKIFAVVVEVVQDDEVDELVLSET